MAMALRVLLLLVLFFATVKAQDSIIDLKEVEEDKQQHVGLSQALRVFTRGANRKLVQDIVLKVAKYLNNGDIALAPAPAPPPSPLDCGGHVEHVVLDANVCHQGPLGTERCVANVTLK
ncbi:hypothetical protein KY289_017810 [Solanum tuberosum]|nr:hypothetical protein KY289_017810 [Solanum tuberosum]